jgi:hypothetical protein
MTEHTERDVLHQLIEVWQYRDVAWIRATWFGNDWVTLLLAAPLLVLGCISCRRGTLEKPDNRRTHRRVVAVYLGSLGIGLTGTWLVLWAAFAFAGVPTPVEPEAFKLVAALDLVLMVPALVLGAALLWRDDTWGFVIAAIASVQAGLYLIVLSVNSYVAIHRGLTTSPGELPLWATLATFNAVATVLLLRGVRRHATAPPPCV